MKNKGKLFKFNLFSRQQNEKNFFMRKIIYTENLIKFINFFSNLHDYIYNNFYELNFLYNIFFILCDE